MKKLYLHPDVEELVMSSANLICESPQPGENEGITYEDWDF